MKTTHHVPLLTAATALATVLLACTDDTIMQRTSSLDRDAEISTTATPIRFGECRRYDFGEGTGDANLDRAVTRGALIDSLTDKDMHTTFGICASLFKAGETSAESVYIDNDKASHVVTTDTVSGTKSHTWQFDVSKTYYWPGSTYDLTFYNYAPYGATGLTVNKGTSATLAPTLTYACPATVSQQQDLLVAEPVRVSGSYQQPVALKFKHALAVVQICEGDTMQAGYIKQVELRKVASEGTYSYTDDAWTLTSGKTANYTIRWDPPYYSVKQQQGAVLTPNDTCFILMPQTFASDAVVRVTFHDATTNTDRVIDGKLAGTTIRQGCRTRIFINIDSDITISTTTDALDAHYVIASVPLKVDNIGSSTAWTLSVAASDGADVSIQQTADLNEFAAQGYWTDKITSGSTTTSARGSSSLSGKGPIDTNFSVFVPENISNSTRNIILSLSSGGSVIATDTLRQLCPAWSADGTVGWEQYQDSRVSSYGFAWDRKVAYVYSYSAPRLTDLYNKQTTYSNYVKSIVENNNASGFASTGYFKYTSNYVNSFRYYILIDYSLMNNLSGLSTDDGLANTKTIYSKGGEILTNNFEDIVSNTKKTESGATSENAFRLATTDNDYASFDVQKPTGSIPKGPMTKADYEANMSVSDNTEGSAAVGEVLKRNRYNITALNDSEGNTSYALKINDEDIVWYLPAVNEFTSLPAAVEDNIDPSDLWSSTPVDGAVNAYLGDKSEVGRNTYHYVRAVRKK